MEENTLSTPAAQRFYDRIGPRYDWFEFYEAKAKERAHQALELAHGQKVLSVGVGTGKGLSQILKAISPEGIGFGLDISPVMIRLTKERTAAPVCQADARQLPYRTQSFDRIFAAYVLDLLPHSDLSDLLAGFHRALNSSGILVLIALTEGVNRSSKTLVAAWKGIFALNPALCGGCRPLQLKELVRQTGFERIEREVIVQMGIPSEIIRAVKN
jgi:ubiquinone/menaquinone biosynthesis C-methylase UbiE